MANKNRCAVFIIIYVQLWLETYFFFVGSFQLTHSKLPSSFLIKSSHQ